jgi:hypothetical protein
MRNKTIFAISIGIIGAASLANAQSLQFTGLQLSNPNSGVVSLDGTNENVYMGALTFSTGTDSIITYCADLSAPLNGNSNPYSVGLVDQSNGTGLALAAKILATNFESATTADQQQGLQLAVWEALYDNDASFDYSTGRFQIVSGVNASALNFASTFYTAGIGSTPTTAVNLYTANSPGGQSQLQVVPEPASMAVLALGAFGLLRRRRSNCA